MCLHTFRRVVDALPDLEKLTLQGLGEPLLAPDLPAMVAHANERGVKVGFNTNGTLLTERRAEELVQAGLDWLHVSVDGARPETYAAIRDGADLPTVERHVRGVVRVLRRLGAERPRLSLVFVAMRRNVDEVPDVVRLAHEWGVGRLYVQNLSHDFSDTFGEERYAPMRAYAAGEALFHEPERAAAAFERAAARAAELGVELRLPRLHEGGRPPRADGAPGCHWPFESAYVTHRGEVQPCCMVMGADRAVLGDASRERFGAIWHGRAYAEFRAALHTDEPPAVCTGCSLYRGLF